MFTRRVWFVAAAAMLAAGPVLAQVAPILRENEILTGAFSTTFGSLNDGRGSDLSNFEWRATSTSGDRQAKRYVDDGTLDYTATIGGVQYDRHGPAAGLALFGGRGTFDGTAVRVTDGNDAANTTQLFSLPAKEGATYSFYFSMDMFANGTGAPIGVGYVGFNGVPYSNWEQGHEKGVAMESSFILSRDGEWVFCEVRADFTFLENGVLEWTYTYYRDGSYFNTYYSRDTKGQYPLTYTDGDVFNFGVGISVHSWGDGVAYFDNVTVAQIVDPSGIPEPATMSLLALGGLALLRRRR